MDLPGLKKVGKGWDLRKTIDAYLGHFDFRGKRALDVGTASGFLTFEMERRGSGVFRHGQPGTMAVGAFPREGFRRVPEGDRLWKGCGFHSQTATACRMVWSNGDGPRFCGWTIGLLERNLQSFNS